MKYIGIACLLGLLVCGCRSASSFLELSSEMVEGLQFTKDPEYGGLTLRYDLSSSQRAVIIVHKEDGTALYTYTTNSDYQNAAQLLGYACQESEWYGSVYFTITIQEGNKKAAEYRTETITASDWFPKEKTVDPGNRPMQDLSWSREKPTSYMEQLQDILDNFSLYVRKGKGKFYAIWYDSKGNRKEEDKELSEQDLKILLDYAKGGTLQRKRIDDPEWQVLDAPNPEIFTAVFEGASALEKRWYEYEMPAADKQKLLDAVKSYCMEGRWPQ